MMGFVFISMPYVFLELHYFYFELIGGMICVFPTVYLFYKMLNADTIIQTDDIPKWKQLIIYLGRENDAYPIVGEKAFYGQSFLDVPYLGLMEFLGKDCVYTWGNKKTIFGLENLCFSPDPRYGNFTHCCWKLGLSNSDEIKMILDEKNMDKEVQELREKIYYNILNWKEPIEKFNDDLKDYDGPIVEFECTEKEEEDMHKKAVAFLEEKR